MTRTRAILARSNLPVLRRFTALNCLLVFDYDGTLSPIASAPDRARMRVRTRRLLASLSTLYPCAAISGRARADIAARLEGTGIATVFGNHGLEAPGRVSRPHPQIRRWIATLGRDLRGYPGILVEDKRHSLSVHYRAARDWSHALATIEPIVRTLPGARIIYGAAAVNLLPAKGANKGAALKRVMASSQRDRAIYVGDDGTDEDAFSAVSPDRLLAIRVGRSSASHARYHIESQAEIDRLLETLIRLRNDQTESR